jgi:5-(carboxyamino)imidazole ribonucleotide mutase
MLANENPDLAAKLKAFRDRQTAKVLESQKELEAEAVK